MITAVLVAAAGVIMATSLLASQLAQTGPRFSTQAQLTTSGEENNTGTSSAEREDAENEEEDKSSTSSAEKEEKNSTVSAEAEDTDDDGQPAGSSNNIFARAYELARTGFLNFLAFISQLTRAPGVQKATCDPTLAATDPGSCGFQFPYLQITVVPTPGGSSLDNQKAVALTASTWSDDEQVSSTYLPTTPLIADVNSAYPSKEISYINSDGKLVIYSASGGNPIVTTAEAAGSITSSIVTGELAPAAIHLDSDNYYEILVPGRVGTTWEGTLKAFKGDGTAVSGLNTTFMQGIPISAPLVEDMDSDGSPEIILPVYHYPNATTSLLGWTWAGGQLIGLNNGNPVLITISGSGGFLPRFSAPSVGNITSTNTSQKEVAAAVENPDGMMSIYVFGKNGSGITQFPSTGAWYQEAINEPIPGTSSSATNPGIGGVALADLGGDVRLELVVVTHKKVDANPWGGYVVRAFVHNITAGSGQIFTPKLETGIVNGIYLGSSRPSIGSFAGQSKAIVFHTIGGSGGSNDNGRGLFAAYYNGSSLAWIDGYSPRTITDKDGSACNIRQEMSLTTVTLGDSDNDQLNEAIYAKYFTYISPAYYYYTVFFYYAQGSPVDDPLCTRALDQYDVTSPLGLQNPGGINQRIEAASNLELADLDNDGLLEMATTLAYPNINKYNRLYIQDLQGPSSSALDWPMAAGNECRQGRYRGSCPPAPSSGPTSTPVPSTPTLTPAPVNTTCGQRCANVVNPVQCDAGLFCGGAPFACPTGMICAEPFVCYNPLCRSESDCTCNPDLYVNSRSNISCNQLCATKGKSCLSVGTDTGAGADGKYWMGTTTPTSFSCTPVSGTTCATVMSESLTADLSCPFYQDTSHVYSTPWTVCRCG